MQARLFFEQNGDQSVRPASVWLAASVWPREVNERLRRQPQKIEESLAFAKLFWGRFDEDDYFTKLGPKANYVNKDKIFVPTCQKSPKHVCNKGFSP
jgi:hypothetical protein